MSSEKLTVSRMNCRNTCQYKHLISCDYGIRAEKDSEALVFGKAFHRAMEERAKGADAQAAFEAALSTAQDWDEFVVAKLQAAIAAYYHVYANDFIASMEPEIEFEYPIEFIRAFTAAGKIDGIAHLTDGRLALVEHKTTSEAIEDADAKYWQRLRLNYQLCRYVKGARAIGKDIETVVYDVYKKPELKPREAVKDVDENGIPFVMDADGNRCVKKDGTPKKTADAAKGERYLTHAETPEEYGARLLADMMERPGFYFQRREVAVTDGQIERFSLAETLMAKQILSVRADAREAVKKGLPYSAAFMKNVGHLTCPYCDYEQFCMSGKDILPNEVPEGFKLTGATPELAK